MKINDQLQFVLDNLRQSWKCRTCGTLWMHFEHDNQDGFFRLCDDPDLLCDQCRFIDAAIESKAIITSERWSNEEDR